MRIRAIIQNYSLESLWKLQAAFLVDQNETAIDEAFISIGPNASAQVAFTHQFNTAGPKVVHTETRLG